MILDTTHAIGWKANDFALQGIDGKTYSLAEVRGPKIADTWYGPKEQLPSMGCSIKWNH